MGRGMFPVHTPKGEGSPGLVPVLGAIALMVFLTCVFLQLQGYGAFEWGGKWATKIGSAVISVLDELWKQPDEQVGNG